MVGFLVTRDFYCTCFYCTCFTNSEPAASIVGTEMVSVRVVKTIGRIAF